MRRVCCSPLHRLPAVPLPHKRERIDVGRTSPRGILSRLRGRGTTQSVVEGEQQALVRLSSRMG